MRTDWVRLSAAVRYVRWLRGRGLDERAQQLLRSKLLSGEIMGEALVSKSRINSAADVGSFREEIGPEFWHEVVVFWHLDTAQRYWSGNDPSGLKTKMQSYLPDVPLDQRRPRQLARKIRLFRSDVLKAFAPMQSVRASEPVVSPPMGQGGAVVDYSSRKGAGGRAIKEHWFRLAGYLAHHVAMNGYPTHQSVLVSTAVDWFQTEQIRFDKRDVERVVAAMYAESVRLGEL